MNTPIAIEIYKQPFAISGRVWYFSLHSKLFRWLKNIFWSIVNCFSEHRVVGEKEVIGRYVFKDGVFEKVETFGKGAKALFIEMREDRNHEKITITIKI